MISILVFAFLSILSNSEQSYVKSIFGHPGVDEVEHDLIDGFEVLQTGLPKPQKKSLYNKGFTAEKIEPEDYPWPGHAFNRTCTADKMKEEYENLRPIYTQSNVTQDQVFWHPAAAKTYYTTDDVLDKADRVKVRFVMSSKYSRHVLPAFLPPGELVTIEIPEGVTISLTINRQCIPIDPRPYNERLYNVNFGITLNKRVNTIASPFGGTLLFSFNGFSQVEINITGVILQPYFFYGMTSDEEWEDELSKLPGPYTYIDTGNVVHIVPSHFVRSEKRLNDAFHWWRSALQISQTTARDNGNYGNPRYERVKNPCIMLYDPYIAYGAAYAMVGANYCVLPPGWIHNVVRYTNAVDNPWGNIHEMDHHHQENWAKTSNAGEMSNNAVNLVVYAKTSMCSSYRSTSGWARFAYASYALNDQGSDQLPRLSNLLHFFGVDKFKEFVKADQEVLWYPRDTYGAAGSEMLRASRIFNRDLRYHWNFHGTNDSVLTKKAIDEVASMKLKPFHPVTNIYAVGSIVDGKAFITARPYRIFPFAQIINFSDFVQRSNTQQFGSFEFQSAEFEPGRSSAWKEESKGVYTLTPKSSLTEIETVNVSYKDKTTGDTHVVICQFTTYYFNNIAYLQRVGNIPLTEDDLFKAYRYQANHSNECPVLTSQYINNGIAAPDYSNRDVNYWLGIGEGNFSVPETGEYVFVISADSEGAFYLSEEPLAGDPDKDADKLLNYQKGTQMSFDLANTSATLTLDSSKLYHYRHIIFPNRGNGFKGRSWVGYKMLGSADDSQVTWETVPASWFKYNVVDEEEMYNSQYHPNFERIYGMDEWDGATYIKGANQTNWVLYKYPAGSVVINSNSGQGTGTQDEPITALVDDDATTEYRVNWWPSNIAVKFPHIFEFDMDVTQSFESIRIGKTGNTNWFAMDSYLEIYLAPYNYSVVSPPSSETETTIPYKEENYSINHNESLIFAGFFDNRVQDYIELNKTVNGRYLKLVFHNNSLKWKDGNEGRTCISAIEFGHPVRARKIYPITNKRYFEFSNRWDLYHGGLYYNGKGITGYAKGQAKDNSNDKNSVMTIKIPKLKPEIGIIGDYQPGSGRAIVKLDGKEIGTIGDFSIDPSNDKAKLKASSRAHKSLLFFKTGIDTSKTHTMTVEVVEGKLTVAGILAYQMVVTYFTDDWRYPRMIETEFSDHPEQYDWYTPSDQLEPEPSSKEDKKKKGLSTGAIVAIVIVVVLVVAAVCVGVFIMARKHMLCFGKNDGPSESAILKSFDFK
ncbi:hypothetical protein M9Y10_029833 [Tritrichomonas musculus]|uniref:Immuno-dominant variable surface antigen-like n=1 Tax=Tritrichomonas musculus TaxID=1915356 RepID=A0ABR2KNE3_9EUKA